MPEAAGLLNGHVAQIVSGKFQVVINPDHITTASIYARLAEQRCVAK